MAWLVFINFKIESQSFQIGYYSLSNPNVVVVVVAFEIVKTICFKSLLTANFKTNYCECDQVHCPNQFDIEYYFNCNFFVWH